MRRHGRAVERLDGLIDGFRFAEARALAVTHLAEHPGDAATWRKYLQLLAPEAGAGDADPDYHRAVRRLLRLAATQPGPEMSRLIESTYRAYASARHPQPALNDPLLLCSLGEQFACTRRLDEARRIANGLLKANRGEPELARLLDVLSARLTDAGSKALANHYSRERSVRFGDVG